MLNSETGGWPVPGGGENIEDYGDHEGDGGARDDCQDSTSQKSR